VATLHKSRCGKISTDVALTSFVVPFSNYSRKVKHAYSSLYPMSHFYLSCYFTST